MGGLAKLSQAILCSCLIAACRSSMRLLPLVAIPCAAEEFGFPNHGGFSITEDWRDIHDAPAGTLVFGFISSDMDIQVRLKATPPEDQFKLETLQRSVNAAVAGPGKSHVVTLQFPDAIASKLASKSEAICSFAERGQADYESHSVVYSAQLVDGYVRNSMEDASTDTYRPLFPQCPRVLLGVRGRLMDREDNGVIISVERVVLSTTPSDFFVEELASRLSIPAYVFEIDSAFKSQLIRLRAVGDEDWEDAIARRGEAATKYFSEPLTYERFLLHATKEQLEVFNTALVADVKAFYSELRDEALNESELRKALTSQGHKPEESRTYAARLAGRHGKKIIDNLSDLLSGNADPIAVVGTIKESQSLLSKQLPLDVLQYATDTWINEIPFYYIDSTGVSVVQGGRALRLFESFARMLENSKAVEANKTRNSVRETREWLMKLDPSEWQSWRGSTKLLAEAKITRPSEPVDPFLRRAIAQRESARQQQRARQQEAFQAKLDRAQASGDMERFMELKAAEGAAAAASIGSDGLSSQFGASAQAEGRLLFGSNSSDRAINVEYPPNHEATPEWQEFLRQKDQYQQAFNEYRQALERLTNTVSTQFTAKRNRAIADLEIFDRRLGAIAGDAAPPIRQAADPSNVSKRQLLPDLNILTQEISAASPGR